MTLILGLTFQVQSSNTLRFLHYLIRPMMSIIELSRMGRVYFKNRGITFTLSCKAIGIIIYLASGIRRAVYVGCCMSPTHCPVDLAR